MLQLTPRASQIPDEYLTPPGLNDSVNYEDVDESDYETLSRKELSCKVYILPSAHTQGYISQLIHKVKSHNSHTRLNLTTHT